MPINIYSVLRPLLPSNKLKNGSFKIWDLSPFIPGVLSGVAYTRSQDWQYILKMNKLYTQFHFVTAFNGDMMRMGKRESAFYDDARFGKRG